MNPGLKKELEASEVAPPAASAPAAEKVAMQTETLWKQKPLSVARREDAIQSDS